MTLTVRIQRPDADPTDPTQDLARRTLADELVDLENGTEFSLPEHDVPDDYHVIVESDFDD